MSSPAARSNNMSPHRKCGVFTLDHPAETKANCQQCTAVSPQTGLLSDAYGMSERAADGFELSWKLLKTVIYSNCFERLNSEPKNISIIHFPFVLQCSVIESMCRTAFGNTEHHKRRVFAQVPYFATWVPIITSPSFMRTPLKGLGRDQHDIWSS